MSRGEFRTRILERYDRDNIASAMSKAARWEKWCVHGGTIIALAGAPFFVLNGFHFTGGFLGGLPSLLFPLGALLSVAVETRVQVRLGPRRAQGLAGAGLLCQLGALLAVEPGRSDEWREHLLVLRSEGRRAVLLAGCGQVKAGLISRLGWLWRDVGLQAVRWVLRSNKRTWSVVTCTIAWIVADLLGQSVGSGLLALIGLAWTSTQAVPWLRDRLDAHPPKAKQGTGGDRS
ncbi:hypothetical protein [Actinomadura fibrosa]|uniref:DUF1275 domain-containing protein n=1 Tax=Actinomadura fibrosa TaxID=111802 RepID=A0ABW2XI18_9ACTN|nr:hypothetical protein [Actinomadura fibrosa]